MPRKKKESTIQNPINDSQIKCVCKNTVKPKDNSFIKCSLCDMCQHIECIQYLDGMSSTQKYVCPFCQFDTSDLFIEALAYLIHPVLMRYLYQTTQSYSFTFYYYSDKLKSRCKKGLENYFITFRCLRLDNTGFCFEWPLNTVIKINNKQVLQIPSTVNSNHNEKRSIVLSWYDNIKEYTQQKALKHYPYDHNILQTNNILRNGANIIEVHIKKRKDEDSFNYVLSGELIELFDEESSAEKIKVISDKKMLMSYMTEVTGQSKVVNFLEEEVSLIDVYTGSERIQTPSRGFNCQHLGVFDLKTFICLNKKNRKYRCPICGKNSRMLYIDGLIKQMMTEYPEQNKLIISSDYSCSFVTDKNSNDKQVKEKNNQDENENEKVKDKDNTNPNQLPNLKNEVECVLPMNDNSNQVIEIIDILDDGEDENINNIVGMEIDDLQEINNEEQQEDDEQDYEANINEDNNKENELITDINFSNKNEEEDNIKFPSIDLNINDEILREKDENLSKQLCNIINSNQFLYNDHFKNIFNNST